MADVAVIFEAGLSAALLWADMVTSTKSDMLQTFCDWLYACYLCICVCCVCLRVCICHVHSGLAAEQLFSPGGEVSPHRGLWALCIAGAGG